MPGTPFEKAAPLKSCAPSVGGPRKAPNQSSIDGQAKKQPLRDMTAPETADAIREELARRWGFCGVVGPFICSLRIWKSWKTYVCNSGGGGGGLEALPDTAQPPLHHLSKRGSQEGRQTSAWRKQRAEAWIACNVELRPSSPCLAYRASAAGHGLSVYCMSVQQHVPHYDVVLCTLPAFSRNQSPITM